MDRNKNEICKYTSVENICDMICSFLEKINEEIMIYLSTDEIEPIRELLGESINAIELFQKIKKIGDISDKLFALKLERYFKGLTQIPEEKRKKYINRIGREKLNKENVFILNVLNRVEELSKIDIFIALFKAKLDDKTDDETYRRLMIMVDRTLFSDLEYLRLNFKEDSISIKDNSTQGLLSAGWLCYSGQSWGSGSDESEQKYKYLNIAKTYLDITNEYLKN